MKRIIFINVLILTVVNAFSQVEVGKKAPDISVDKWINIQDFDDTKIEGKAIVLDFWFTHCAPCVYTIPHLNELFEKYKNENIVFIALTYENEDEVLKFLSKKELLPNVGIDTTYQTIKRFEVEGYPTTFLIDEKGILRWEGHPSHLNSDMIDALLDKSYYPDLNSEINIQRSTLKKELTSDYVYPITVSINDYMNGASGMQFNSRELSIVNQSLDEIMSLLLQKSESRIFIADSNQYDIRFKIPKELSKGEIRPMVTKSLLNKLSYKIEITSKEVEGFDLLMSNDSLFINNAINSGKVYYGLRTSTYQTYWKGDGAQISDLMKELEDRFGIFIKDQTLLFGFFEFKFPISSFDNAKNYLLETYGLELAPSYFQAEITEIRNKHDTKYNE